MVEESFDDVAGVHARDLPALAALAALASEPRRRGDGGGEGTVRTLGEPEHEKGSPHRDGEPRSQPTRLGLGLLSRRRMHYHLLTQLGSMPDYRIVTARCTTPLAHTSSTLSQLHAGVLRLGTLRGVVQPDYEQFTSNGPTVRVGNREDIREDATLLRWGVDTRVSGA
ncbi:hypothetical protein BDZ91DRAFT_820095 [Kalaharituber pfeilii]|nr:hypothetical protein BDZ91DRAFT_820095 [Kalaharituber pfeilii]